MEETIALDFDVLGFFKLKVRDRNLCVSCKTKDCAISCEVGLSNMPGEFIKNGYFKSAKCVGSGDCIRACPYNNIYFYDVRNYLKEKLHSGNTYKNSHEESLMTENLTGKK